MIFPQHDELKFPLTDGLVFPAVDPDSGRRIVAGHLKRPLLGEKVRPFAEVDINPIGDLISAEWRKEAGANTPLTGTTPRQWLSSARAIEHTADELRVVLFWLRLIFEGGVIEERAVSVRGRVHLINRDFNPAVGQAVRIFTGARIATDSAQLASAHYEITGPTATPKTALTGDLLQAIAAFSPTFDQPGFYRARLYAEDLLGNEVFDGVTVIVE